MLAGCIEYNLPILFSHIIKLFILSLVIILGISIEKIGYHYLSNYINSVDLSSLQEFLVRLSFPILAFIILWIIKSL